MTDRGISVEQPKKDVFDRREQRAVGYFIDLLEARAKQNDLTLWENLKALQEEHFCYD